MGVSSIRRLLVMGMIVASRRPVGPGLGRRVCARPGGRGLVSTARCATLPRRTPPRPAPRWPPCATPAGSGWGGGAHPEVGHPPAAVAAARRVDRRRVPGRVRGRDQRRRGSRPCRRAAARPAGRGSRAPVATSRPLLTGASRRPSRPRPGARRRRSYGPPSGNAGTPAAGPGDARNPASARVSAPAFPRSPRSPLRKVGRRVRLGRGPSRVASRPLGEPYSFLGTGGTGEQPSNHAAFSVPE